MTSTTSVPSTTTPTNTTNTSNTSNTSSTSSTSTDGTSAAALDQNFDEFLQLLTTQLQNQDPLDPMDTTQFTNQLVEFSQVEQQLKTNDTLSSLLSLQTVNMTSLGVSFIGKNVQAEGSTFSSTNSGQSVNLAYSVASTPATGTISITDANGNVVYNTPINLTSGTHDFTWNGTETDGTQAPAGTYTLTVSASDATGAPITTTTYVPGTVSGLETSDDGTLMLDINGSLVPMTDVRQVSDATSS